MILQVLADSWKRYLHRNADLSQIFRATNSEQFENLRSFDRSGGNMRRHKFDRDYGLPSSYDNLLSGMHNVSLAGVGEFYSRSYKVKTRVAVCK